MADCNRAAIGVHVLGVVRQPELSQYGQSLRGKGFVELDHADASELDARVCKEFARGRHRPDSHDPGSNTGGGRSDDARPNAQSIAARGSLAREQ
jgi:hypothetical protein